MSRFTQSGRPFRDDQFYAVHEIAAKLNVDKQTIWRWAACGRLPKQRKLGPGTSRWLGHELNAKLLGGEADHDAA